MASEYDAQLLHYALNSPKRIVSFDEVSTALGIRLEDVPLKLIKAIANGSIIGRIDAEISQLVIDGTMPPPATPDVIRQSIEGLKKLEDSLGDTLNMSRTAQKRHHSSV